MLQALVCQKTIGLLGVGSSAMRRVGQAFGLGTLSLGNASVSRVALRPAAGGGM